MYPTPIQDRPLPVRVAYRLVLYVAIAAWIAPLIAIVMTAIRAQGDLLAGNYWGMPQQFALVENFREIFASSPMGMFFVNSIVVTVTTVVGVLVLSTLAAVALAKYPFPGRTLVFSMFIAGNFVPYQILMIPVRGIVLSLGLYDSIWALIIFHTAFQTGFATLFLRNFVVALPNELFEAARLEGASEFTIIWQIIVPLLRPALAGLSVLVFTFVWNDYFWALVLVQSDAAKPLTLGLAGLKGEWLTAWNLISAGSLAAALPPVALFFLTQKHFVAGLTVGAVKS
ncbi:carbohydrate ABC transporter permease [Bradyrhizobium liaoningense]|uniref:carbohydrate ABC transporter permease n=1 Tax=Bradyrhizobium TaxID=374 RepID=UPI00140EB507|nr:MULTISPECIES: carbohydrate ABC transporter permease [Bradyrhizobium]MBR0738743.1 carbohydrate ABC transporter permease [Bradyrhizobium liaoningense]QIO32994.1 carbohydrate ABC transporter permease [Bradyrhizobium sp. 1(2017)]